MFYLVVSVAVAAPSLLAAALLVLGARRATRREARRAAADNPAALQLAEQATVHMLIGGRISQRSYQVAMANLAARRQARSGHRSPAA